MTPPRVFISYSHDSAEHKSWVLDFATTLRNRGIDAVLDQWDLRPGDDLPHFMETELARCDYVLMVCTEPYVAKANAGSGGVGYEKMIVTAALLQGIDDNKIIPILRQQGTSIVPTFLRTKVYVDFSSDSEVEYALDELLRTLLKAPLFEKPEIGNSPFTPLTGSRPDRTADGLKEAMKTIAAGFQQSASEAIYLRDFSHLTGMHRLSLDKYMRQAIVEGLLTRDPLQRYSVTDKGYDYLIGHGIVEA